jgi:hypothetical protein
MIEVWFIISSLIVAVWAFYYKGASSWTIYGVNFFVVANWFFCFWETLLSYDTLIHGWFYLHVEIMSMILSILFIAASTEEKIK